MAAASSLLTEERFLCSVCLDVFTEPVSTPCGHNFCSACIHKYWDSGDSCQCPLCKKIFSTRPELQVNTIMSELAGEFKKLAQVKVSTPKASTPDPQLPAEVLCDVCSEIKEKAVKSCLVCLTSFCEVHLEPHQRVAVLKSHTLLDPVKNLDERMCKTHNKITELYCRTDKAFICVLCFKTDHKHHSVVPLEEEYETVMAKKDEAKANIQKLIQSQSEKIAEVENSLDASQIEIEKEKEATIQVFTDLIRSIQRSQAEFIEAIEERHRATKEKAAAFLRELRIEITELESRSSQLEQLSQSEDHYHFLQSFPTLCSPLNKDSTSTGVHIDLCFEAMRRAVTLLIQRVDEIMEDVPEINMKRMREHALDLTLDPDTAHCSLVISQDGKQVANEGTVLKLPSNPKRFEMFPEVLAKEGFTAGKFYFEVQVKGKTSWTVGVVRESVERKKNAEMSVLNGFWTLELDKGKYESSTKFSKITLKEKLHKVGIFVDYNKGVVSFYDVDSKLQICSLISHFTEKLYPYFCPQFPENGRNSAPLIITPVPQTD
ncbi:E3 ubiquitin-protein ligase TRIM39 [Lates calcarifer]|uniref:E3 ubiquitin-protein ligase TRIM39 n=1 Tax=Lates calcarifer TaxID=8187 RepID=A0AAJ7LLD4_LATCA|nr:E3 ubiquitin-protein ligase TRIM39 [Lates calcarifer]